MRKSILITGVPGTGKTSTSDALVTLGYKSYDLDRMKDLFIMVDKITRLPVVNHDNKDLKKVEVMDWVCQKEKLESIIENESAPFAFYCGMPSNLEELIPLFDHIILLKADETENKNRLANRTGRNDFGRTKEVQDWIMGWKPKWEHKMIERGAIVVDANKELNQVTKEIILATNELIS